jgi:hypothetical protein
MRIIILPVIEAFVRPRLICSAVHNGDPVTLALLLVPAAAVVAVLAAFRLHHPPRRLLFVRQEPSGEVAAPTFPLRENRSVGLAVLTSLQLLLESRNSSTIMKVTAVASCRVAFVHRECKEEPAARTVRQPLLTRDRRSTCRNNSQATRKRPNVRGD